MLAPLPPHRHRPVRPLHHGDRMHAPRQRAPIQLPHLHPLPHDEKIVRDDRAVGLVLDEFLERL